MNEKNRELSKPIYVFNLKKQILLVLLITIASSVLCTTVIMLYVSHLSADPRVVLWWIVLSTISLVNFYIWAVSYKIFKKNSRNHEELYESRKWYSILALIYVIVCAFRSFFPRADVQRIVLVDSWLSSVIIGRSLATIAEMCFMTLLSLYLHESAKFTGSRFGLIASKLIVPAIGIAEIFSWYSVLTTSFLGNIVEQTIWGCCGLLAFLIFLTIWPKALPEKRKYLFFLLIVALGHFIYMFAFDVPMYISRYLADEAAGKSYFSLLGGFMNALQNWTQTFRWEDWNSEMTWMIFYFSITVWLSIIIKHFPRYK